MRRLLLLTALISFTAPAFAEPPVPSSKKERLGSIEKNLEEHQHAKEQLEGKVKEIGVELDDTKSKLVKAGKSIQDNEKVLEGLEDKIAELEVQQDTLQETLKHDQHSIAKLVLALERIRRVPPEAMIIKPGAPLKAAQSAMLMQDIIPALHRQADTLRANLENLDKVSKDLTAKRERAQEANIALNSEHKELTDLVEKRQELYASTHEDLKEQEASVEKISAEARNLQDLVKKLEDERSQPPIARGPNKTVVSMATTIPGLGKAQLPVSGVVSIRYNEPDDFGAPSQGVTIESRSGALVVAPMDGVVRFAGPFKNYGNLVILEHKNGYHSLIAGLEKIDTVVGHSVSAGEPLGLLRKGAAGDKPSLYYELRQNGRPVNPATKFADLG